MKNIYTSLLALAFAHIVQAQTICNLNTGSMHFAAPSEVVLALDSLPSDSTLTLEAWIYPTLFGSASWRNTIIGKDAYSGAMGEAGFGIRCGGNGVLSFVLCGKDSNGVSQSWKELLTADSALHLNTWAHVASTFDGHYLRSYVNGVLMNTLNYEGKIYHAEAYDMKIGATPETTSSRYFNGNIDEVKIWNKALTQSEIQANMNHQLNAQSYTALLGYWRLNQAQAATIIDNSIYNNVAINNTATSDTLVPFQEQIISGNIAGNTTSMNAVSNIYTVNTQPDNTLFWVVSNGIIVAGQGTDSVTISFIAAGQATVKAIIGNAACTQADTTVLNVNVMQTSIKKIAMLNINVAPNPATNNVNFNFENAANYSIKIVDVCGKTITTQNTNGKTSCAIDVHSFSKGLYFYEVFSENEFYALGKLMIE